MKLRQRKHTKIFQFTINHYGSFRPANLTIWSHKNEPNIINQNDNE